MPAFELVEKAHRKVFAPLFSKSGWVQGQSPARYRIAKAKNRIIIKSAQRLT